MTDPLRTMPWLIRIALRSFPRAFRDAFAADMGAAFLDGLADRVGRQSRLQFTVGTAVGMIRSGMRERRHPTLTGDRRGIQASATGRIRVVEALVSDLVFAVRSLSRRPAFAIVAVATLTLGIGANTAVFSIVDAVLLRPLPYIDPDGLVLVYAHDRESPDGRGVMSLPDTRDVAELPGLASVVAYREGEATLTNGTEPEVVPDARVADGLLRTFRLDPLIGRDIRPSDNDPGSSLVVVIGYRLWKERYEGSADVIGKSLELSGRTYEIVGVAPEGFVFPDDARLWIARRLNVDDCGRGCHTLLAIGRLAPGESVQSVQQQLNTLAATLTREYPQTNVGKLFRAVRLSDDRVADVRAGLWFVFGSVGLVLLIACANVANLLIVRGESRRGEVAVRRALGASRGRLAIQVMMESLVLAMAGVAGGLLVARTALVPLRNIPAGTLPGVDSVSLDGRVLLFTIAVGLGVALVFGVSPAFRAGGSAEQNLVSGRHGHGGPEARRGRSLLLAAEVALSVLLLAGAGLLLKSFDRLYRTDLGFEMDNLTRFRLVLPSSSYDTLPEIIAFYQTLEERLAAVPGVESVGSAYGPPLGVGHMTGDILVDGRPEPEPGQAAYGAMHSATPGYLDTYRVPLLRGRWIEPSDGFETLPVAVVNETFVRLNFPNDDPIGQRFRVTADFGWGSPTWTIVGIIGDVPLSLTSAAESDVFVPLSQYGPGSMTITLRSRAGIVPVQPVRDIVRDLDPSIPLRSIETVQDALDHEIAPTRFYMLSVGTFAGLAIVLACVGLYGVVAYLVARRTPEIGIRIALGARRDQVVGMVLSQGVRPAFFGVAIGLLLTLALGRVVESLLHSVSPRDPAILGSVGLLILVVTFGAALLPARRASRIDPVSALRSE